MENVLLQSVCSTISVVWMFKHFMHAARIEVVVVHGDGRVQKASMVKEHFPNPGQPIAWRVCDLDEVSNADIVLFAFSLCSAKSYFDVVQKHAPTFKNLLEAFPRERLPQSFVLGTKCDRINSEWVTKIFMPSFFCVKARSQFVAGAQASTSCCVYAAND